MTIGLRATIPELRGGNGAASPQILLSATSVPENTSIGGIVGILSVSNGSGTYTFSIQPLHDPDDKFDIANDDELVTSNTLNYETDTTHPVTITADNGVDDPIERTFNITVTNVLEVTLSALTLNTDTIDEGSIEDTLVGTLQSTSAGSSLSMTDTAGGRFKLSGSNVVAGATATDYDVATSHNITVRETHADGSNSPRDSVIAIDVNEVVVGGAVDRFAAVNIECPWRSIMPLPTGTIDANQRKVAATMYSI